MENNPQSSFWQFSDQLRLQTNSLANLSLNDSIWSTSYGSKRTEDRRNFDIRVGGDLGSVNPKRQESDFNGFNHSWKIGGSDFNEFSDGWKSGSSGLGTFVPGSSIGLNGGFNKGIYSKPSMNYGNFNNLDGVNVSLKTKGIKNGKGEDHHHHYKGVKKNKNNGNNGNKDKDKDGNNGENKNSADKRFKTLPPSESLPRHETIGGYIFVCNNDTMAENLKRQLFGLPPRYRDSVRQITPGLPLFLYNYSTHQLHGIFEAASFGGSNIDPMAWEDKKNLGESRFPAQVRVMTRKICEPLEEDSFRPILHHYDGPKFRLELNIPEALSLLDIFDENNP
ncbi:hypothetical protein NMG60_11030564 [Bertholletia excelsa]